ncbi:type II 3-dehydroquinate dehydratase, partial [uncultured Muribaculum sp.]
MNITIINGPNLNLLGIREPGIYGSKGFDSYLEELRNRYPQVDIAYFQSNHEGDIIDKLHEVGFGATD